ncbi:putative ankyrin repeat protein [Paramyrothecium foliicola]|nr:putative ankyrin repeat protein [Paramyrothecium foliicola]
MASSRSLNKQNWERHKTTIKRLYLEEGLRLRRNDGGRDVIQVMRDEYNFTATRSQYLEQIRRWDSYKNLKTTEWKLVLSQLDYLRDQKIEARVRVSGQVVEESKIKRARRHTRHIKRATHVPTSTWLSMPEYGHISIEVQDKNGFWSSLSKNSDPTLCSNLELSPVLRNQSLIFLQPDFDPAMESFTDPVGSIQGPLTQCNSAPVSRNFPPQPLPEFCLDAGFLSSIEVPQGLIQHRGHSTTIDHALLQSSPFYQWFYKLSHERQQEQTFTSPQLGLRIAWKSPTHQFDTITNAFPTSQQFVKSSLEYAERERQEYPWHDGPPLPSIDQVLERLRSLLPETSEWEQTSGVVRTDQHNNTFEQMFSLTMVYSVTNGFLGFRGIPNGSVFKSIRSSAQLSQNLFRFLQTSTPALARPFGQNLFRAAVEACDLEAIQLVIQTMKKAGHPVSMSDIKCIFRGSDYTPLELAIRLESLETLNILIKFSSMNSNSDETATETEENPTMSALLSWLAVGGKVAKVNPDIVRTILRAGAGLDCRTLRRLAWLIREETELQKELIFRMTANNHYDLLKNLRLLVAELDNTIALTFVQSVIHLCEKEQCYCYSKLPALRIEILRRASDKFLMTDPLQDALQEAAQRGNIDLCRLLLSCKSVAHEAFFAAIRGGDRETIHLFLEHGAGVHGYAVLRESTWTTPLAEAIRSKDAELMQLVENLGAWAVVAEEYHFRAAIEACTDVGDIISLERLFHECQQMGENQKDSLVESTDITDGLTLAIQESRIALASKILDMGFDSKLLRPLHAALRQKNREAVDILLELELEAGECNGHRDEVRAIMDTAMEWGNISIIQDLLAMDPLYPFFSSWSGMALRSAVRFGSMSLVGMIIHRGMSLEIAIQGCSSPLYNAIEKEDGKMIQFILTNGADPADSSAFLAALDKQRGSFALLLLAFKTRYPRGLKGFGARLLIETIKLNNKELLDVLLDAKMDVLAYSARFGETPLTYAIRRGHWKRKGLFKRLLDAVTAVNGIDISVRCGYRNLQRRTPLLDAIETANTELVSLIIESGADINRPARRHLDRTPLQKACEIGSFSIVKMLLDKGAEVNSPPTRCCGGTALQLAAGTGSISIVRLLLSHGADIHVASSAIGGRSALEAAAENGCLDIVKILWDETHGMGFGAGEVGKAINFAKEGGHLSCAEYIEELQEASDRTFQELIG